MTDDFAAGIDVPQQPTPFSVNRAPSILYRVQGEGKYAALFAQDKGHARSRFTTEFYPGVTAEKCEQV